MFWIILFIVGFVAWGVLGYWMKGNEGFGGWWATFLAALVGAWLGNWVLGSWWWVLEGFNVVAGLIGALVLGWIWNLIKTQA
jgi:uncharacterized membrane protein YeaQ/YmgE (transglycosylase-associated protein family)